MRCSVAMLIPQLPQVEFTFIIFDKLQIFRTETRCSSQFSARLCATGAFKEDITSVVCWPNLPAWSIRSAQSLGIPGSIAMVSKGNILYLPQSLCCWPADITVIFLQFTLAHTFCFRARLFGQRLSQSSYCWPLTSGKWAKCQETSLQSL